MKMDEELHSDSWQMYSSLGEITRSIDQVPRYLRHNPYIRRGYRHNFTRIMCLTSMFQWNNETLNIWTHAIGSFAVCVIAAYHNVELAAIAGINSVDFLIHNVTMVSFLICLLISTGYHMFNCRSESAYNYWLQLDLSGVCVAILGCYLPAVYYGFYCVTFWRDVYLSVITSLGICLCVVRIPKFNFIPFLPVEVLFYAMGLFGLVPYSHWLIHHGLEHPFVQSFLWQVIVIYALCSVAVFFYVSKFPECFNPGRFDYILSSHQCWHCVINVIFVYCAYNCMQMIRFVKSTSYCDF